ncbi:hypothetical protein IFM46972_04313 [Aspergillus udagawae]|uniref:Uncharacterized protein n=1 Tax=Aspergillus udagawae TaxID=91492 RepID=A0A8H3NRA7_9EURO|nr:hypothetical protein IFM46972_04313 [Aspergillus udagawae]
MVFGLLNRGDFVTVNPHEHSQTEKDFMAYYCVASLVWFGRYFHDQSLDIREIREADSVGSKGVAAALDGFEKLCRNTAERQSSYLGAVDAEV